MSPRQTLLIVGNDADTRALEHLLNSLYHICVVDTLDRLVSIATDVDPALALIFPRVGENSGLNCAQVLKDDALLSDITILLVLEANSQAEELKALQIGVLDCLTKPINPIVLHAKIENHMLMAEQKTVLELASCTDGLTGLANRTQLDTTILLEWYRAKRGRQPVSALMIDVDFFKSFNDKFGHLQGDQCLKSIANVIKNMRHRKTDFSARFGGEEFVIILPFTDSKGAIQVANEVLRKVRELNIPRASNKALPVTVSIGVSTCYPHIDLKTGSEPMELLTRADLKLYQAKKSGRNKVCF